VNVGTSKMVRGRSMDSSDSEALSLINSSDLEALSSINYYNEVDGQ